MWYRIVGTLVVVALIVLGLMMRTGDQNTQATPATQTDNDTPSYSNLGK